MALSYAKKFKVSVTDITFTGIVSIISFPKKNQEIESSNTHLEFRFDVQLRFEFVFPSGNDDSTLKIQDKTTVALSFLRGYTFGFRVNIGDRFKLPNIWNSCYPEELLRQQIDKNMLWPLQIRLTGPGENINTRIPRPRSFTYITDLSLLYPSYCNSPPASFELLDKSWGNNGLLLRGHCNNSDRYPRLQYSDSRNNAYLCFSKSNVGIPISAIRVVSSHEDLADPNYVTVGSHEIISEFAGIDLALSSVKGRSYLQYMHGDPRDGPWLTDIKLVLDSELIKLKEHMTTLSESQQHAGVFPFKYKNLVLCTSSSPSGNNEIVHIMFRIITKQDDPSRLVTSKMQQKFNPVVRESSTTPIISSTKSLVSMLSFAKSPTPLHQVQKHSETTISPSTVEYINTLCQNSEVFTRFPCCHEDLKNFTHSSNTQQRDHQLRILELSTPLADLRKRLVPSSLPYVVFYFFLRIYEINQFINYYFLHSEKILSGLFIFNWWETNVTNIHNPKQKLKKNNKSIFPKILQVIVD